MLTSGWFDNYPVIGRLERHEAAEKLRELGEEDAALKLERRPDLDKQTYGLIDRFRSSDPAYRHAAHAFGYIGPHAGAKTAIYHVGDIEPDLKLKNTRVKITLDGLRVAEYPGSGDHRILFDFYAQNQLADDVEHVHFNSTYRVRQGERAAILNFPIFVALNIGEQGLIFKCFTVNVRNDQDEAFLGMLESDVFKAGLRLASTMQPAIAPLSGIAVALTKSIAGRHKNVPVQDFYLGLDFGNTSTGARLAAGSYIAVQIPESFRRIWNWNEWLYEAESGQVVNKNDPEKLIPYNYVILGISPHS